MIIFEAHRKDSIDTGFRYSIRQHGREPTATNDVVEAIEMLKSVGVERPADLIDEARKFGRVEIQERR